MVGGAQGELNHSRIKLILKRGRRDVFKTCLMLVSCWIVRCAGTVRGHELLEAVLGACGELNHSRIKLNLKRGIIEEFKTCLMLLPQWVVWEPSCGLTRQLSWS